MSNLTIDYFKIPLMLDKTPRLMSPKGLYYIEQNFDPQNLDFKTVIDTLKSHPDKDLQRDAINYKTSMNILLSLNKEPIPTGKYRLTSQGIYRNFTENELANLEEMKQTLANEIKQKMQQPLVQLTALEPLNQDELLTHKIMEQQALMIYQEMKQLNPNIPEMTTPNIEEIKYKKWSIQSLDQLPEDCSVNITTYFNPTGTISHKQSAEQTLLNEITNIDNNLKKFMLIEKNFTDNEEFFDVWTKILDPGPDEHLIIPGNPIPANKLQI